MTAYPDSRTRAKVRIEPLPSPSRPRHSLSTSSAGSSMLGFPIPTDLLLALLLNKTLLASAALLVRAWLGTPHNEQVHSSESVPAPSSSTTSWATATFALSIAAAVQLLWFRAWEWLPAVQRVDKKRLVFLAALLFAQLLVWLMALRKIDAVNVILFTQYCEIWAADLAKSVRGRSYGGYSVLLALAISFLATISSAGSAAPASFADVYADGDLRRGRPAELASPSRLQAASAAAEASVSVFGTLAGHAYLLVYALLTIEKERAMLSASRDTGGRRKAGIVATIAACGFVLPVSLGLRVLGFRTLPPLSSVVPRFASVGGHLPAYLAVAFGMLILDPLVSTSIEPHASTKQRAQHGWPIAVLASFGIGFVGFGFRPLWSQLVIAVLVAYGLRTILKTSPDHASSRFLTEDELQDDKSRGGEASFVQDLMVSVRNAATSARRTVKIILASPDSRKIFQFLVLNLAFMGVQLVWGVWTNSLGLISDAIHMFFDCAAIGMGLFASVMAQWPTDATFTHGYGRVETLSGFANGVFLILISVFIVFEAVQRIIEPPIMHNTTQLLIVSAMGLGVNLFGMWATGGHHHHGHSHSHDHDHGHGHSHNMMGVYLHVMADTLGSVGVIISTLLINQFGWTGFDPIASLFIAFMIVGSVIPLVVESGRILCLDIGDERETSVVDALAALSATVPTVVSYSSPRFWPKDAETLVGVLRVHTAPDGVYTPESVATQVELFLKSRIAGLESVAVQLDALPPDANGHAHTTPTSIH